MAELSHCIFTDHIFGNLLYRETRSYMTAEEQEERQRKWSEAAAMLHF